VMMSTGVSRDCVNGKTCAKLFDVCVAVLGNALFRSVCPDRVRAGATQLTTATSTASQSHLEELSSSQKSKSLTFHFFDLYTHTRIKTPNQFQASHFIMNLSM